MQWFWNAFYGAAIFVLGPRWIWRALTKGEYVNGLWAKLTGRAPQLPDNGPVIWMHAVCVGEVLLLRPLIENLQRYAPGYQIVLSTFTNDGWKAAHKAYPNVPIFYVPFDFTWSVRRVYRALRPQLLLLSELELWPNLLLEAGRRGVPVVVASSRMNDVDLEFYRRLNRWHRPALRCVRWWGAQTARDAERIAELLGPDHTTSIAVTGSLKYDAAPLSPSSDSSESLRTRLGCARGQRLLLAGSTHAPEEQLLLDVLRSVRRRRPELRLLLAPREQHRCASIEKLITASGLSMTRLSRTNPPAATAAAVVLVDTVADLPLIWGIADFGFVGGTWALGIGGQSPIEPAALGKPVCFGPHVWNFEQPASGLLAAGAAAQFQTPEQLEAILERWLNDPHEAAIMGRSAAEFVLANQGAADTTQRAIASLLSPGPAAASTHG